MITVKVTVHRDGEPPLGIYAKCLDTEEEYDAFFQRLKQYAKAEETRGFETRMKSLNQIVNAALNP